MKEKVFHGVLFDLDGTLADSIPDLIDASLALLQARGQASLPDEQIKAMVGKGVAVLVIRLWYAATGVLLTEKDPVLLDLVKEFNQYYHQFNGKKTYTYQDVPEVLSILKSQGLKLGVVTNKPAQFTEPLLGYLNIKHFFDVIVSGDTCERKKPHGMQLEYAAQMLGVDVSKVLMVGDSNNDLLAAQSANVPCVLLSYGYTEGLDVRTLGAWKVIDHFKEVLPIVLPQAH